MTLAATWFDGLSARGREVRLSVHDGQLRAEHVSAEGDDTSKPGAEGADTAEPNDAGAPAETRWPLADVVWPEPTRHGQRVVELRGGGTLVVADKAAFDAWFERQRLRKSLVVRAQRSWRGVAIALVLLVATVAAGYRWGVPLAAQGLVAALPSSADQALGDAALERLDKSLLYPSRVPHAGQQLWRQRFEQMLARAHAGPRAERPVPWQLHFRLGGDELGANALALPGGHIVITDEMLALLEGAPDAVLGVLAHEYGHVRRRHGMNAVARLALVSLALSAAMGDASSVVLAVPVLLAQADYSREAEREADADAARILRDSGRSPAALVVLFERMAAERKEKASDSKPQSPASAASAASAPTGRKLRPQLPIAFASHPQDEERIRFFRDEALR